MTSKINKAKREFIQGEFISNKGDYRKIWKILKYVTNKTHLESDCDVRGRQN